MAITSGPETITDAILGGTARFECIVSSTSYNPGWNINGDDYRIAHLPSGFSSESNSYSRVLIVNPVQQEMNNTCVYCYLLFYNNRQESSRAKLIVQLPAPSQALILVTTNHHSSSAVIYSPFISSRHFSSKPALPIIPLSEISHYQHTTGKHSHYQHTTGVKSVSAVSTHNDSDYLLSPTPAVPPLPRNNNHNYYLISHF